MDKEASQRREFQARAFADGLRGEGGNATVADMLDEYATLLKKQRKNGPVAEKKRSRWKDAATVAVVLYFGIAAYGGMFAKDSTDPEHGRSGMGLRIDHFTGCHYLTSAGLLGESGIVPRMDSRGYQICSGPEGGDDAAWEAK